jgi:hypothetical protein
MKVKNIQQFRTLWRNQEGYNMSDWNENFIGSVHNSQMFGFYRMVNGIVDNIKADLKPKLQNAQDEQAIYEFLQNAADSQSTECAVIYDENYFMVLNNGKPFSDKDLKALLNSFQGTKADKTKPENCGKIGRYGIGFKLAYRLMGKSDGADELLNDLAGPLLFSWHNEHQFDDLMNYSANAVNANDDDVSSTDTPWLLKIILACFPTGLGEEVHNLDYNQEVLFKNEELMEMVNFLQKHREKLEQLSLPQGSLFFLKFGPKKHEKLKESLLNIQSGIGYSMNTLKTLEKVVLQDVVIEKYEADFERYSILPGTEDFLRIDPEFPACPVEIALGFPSDIEQLKTLKRAPSIYQFFPMRNERHNMAYFVHASSFAKITDRTRLDDQGEANIETFKYIAKALKRNLLKYKQDNFDQYATIYRSLLLSDKSDEYDADLINNHLYNPMLEFIRTSIPTHKKNFYLKDLVVVKNTRMNIDPMSLGIGKEWFLWTNLDLENDLMREAANNAKLGLRRWGLKELIKEGNPQLVDNWITNLSNHEYKIFVEELKDVDFDEEFLEQFQYIKCFRFSDNQGNVNFYSIKDLQDQPNVFLMSERTMPVRDEIKSLGFAVLEFNILDYAVILRQLEDQLDYLSNDRALYLKISERTLSANLSAEQKHALFNFMKDLDGVRKDEIRNLPLFSNAYGINVPLSSILPLDAEVEPWLEGFKIYELEDAEVLQDYFAQLDSWELYQNIIAPYWNDLVKHASLNNEEELLAMYTRVRELYLQKSSMPKLTEAMAYYVDAETGFVSAEELFYFKTLSEVLDYNALKSAMQKVLNLYLPHPSILDHLSTEPFRLSPTPSNRTWRMQLQELLANVQTAELSANEKKALFALLKTVLKPNELNKLQLFENNKGERVVLSSLIPSIEEVEAWLKAYQIKKEEDVDWLEDYLAKPEDIYTNIIAPNWEHLTANKNIYSQIGEFYKGVSKYASIARSAKPLITQAYVFVNAEVGFVSSTLLFYHTAMNELENYNDLRKAINTLTDYHTPHPEVLPFLKEKAFKTRDSSLGSLLKYEERILSREEVTALQFLIHEMKESTFKLMTIEEGDNSREFKVAKRSKSVPYYLDKSQQKLAEKIRAAFGESYKLLPYKLYFEELDNEGLLMGSALFNTLSKAKDASPELLSAMIVESGNADVQEQVFGKIGKIILKQGKIYDKDSFEHQALQIFRNKDADHAKVREKIHIEDAEGNLHKLTNIAFDPNICFSIERDGKYNLELAKVLPRFAEIQALLDDVLEKLVDYEAPTSLKRRCFEMEEKPLRKIFAELRNDYKVLENASQLAFVMLMAKVEENNKILRDFSLSTKNGAAVDLLKFETLHLQPTSFVHPEAVVDPGHYANLAELLRMEEGTHRSSFEFGNQKVVFKPFFEKSVFYAAPLKDLSEDNAVDELQRELLDYAFDLWSKEEEQSRELELYTDDHPAFTDFDFKAMVYPKSYALVREQLPEWLNSWLGEIDAAHSFDDNDDPTADVDEVEAEDRLAFLIALGLNSHRSSLVRLRRYLNDKLGQGASQKQLNDIHNTNKQHLLNTILWLQSEGTVFSSEDDRIHWVRKLYNTLDQVGQNTPLPYITEVEGEEEEIFNYQLDRMGDFELRYFDQKQQIQLRDEYEVGMAHVRLVMEQANIRITDIALKHLNIPTSNVEEELDLEDLEAASKEWGASHYLKWREENPFKVYLYDGKMPYLLRFLGQVVKVLRKGNAVVQDRIAFVNSHSTNVEESLFEVSSRNGLSELTLLQLLRYKNETASSVSQHPVIERVVERVVVSEEIDEDDEIIENPELNAIKGIKEETSEGELKLSIDLNSIPDELLEQLMSLAKNSKLIVPKNRVKKDS